MFASSNSTDLQFKNLGGIICLNLLTNMSDVSVSSISLSANQPMSGPISNVASLSYETPVAATVSGSAGVTLDCGAGVAINGTAKPFYIAVPAGEYTGLSIAVTTITGAGQTFTLKSDKSIVVGRSQITVISLTANNIHTTYNLTDGNVTVPDGETATVTGSSDDHTLTVGAGANVTLQNTRSRQIITQGDATLTLVGDNVVAPITIDRFNAIIPANNSTLTINGTGSLDCTRWNSGTRNACISNNTVNLIVEGGDLTMTSSKYRGATAVYVYNYTQTGGTMTIDVGSTNNDGDSFPEGLYATNDILISGGSISSMGSVAIYAGHNMEISGGTVVATANGQRNYYGSCGLSAGGTLTISGGTVTASGEGGAVTGPGIGAVGSCGNIVITGGNITVSGYNSYGNTGSAGIGTGSASSGVCGTITITDGIERLAITKAGNAQAVVGKGNASSTVGTITIDGVADPTAESSFPHLSLAVSNGGNTWIFTPKTGPSSLADLKDMVNANEDCSAYLGYYVYSDGNIGTDATDAIGIVAFTSIDDVAVTGIDPSCRILVIGLTDNEPRSYYNVVERGLGMGVAIAGVSCTEWRIPTKVQWEVIYGTDGLGGGSFANLCGESSTVKLYADRRYWSSTVESHYSSSYTWYDRIWAVMNGGWASFRDDTNSFYIRAAFTY